MQKEIQKHRCFGNGDSLYEKYHDTEWGIPTHDERLLFEMLCLEGAQAGLSWLTILRRREDYKNAFHNFDVLKVSNMTDSDLEKLLTSSNIIKNKLKVYSVRKNAKSFIKVQQKFGSFDKYIWGFVDFTPIKNNFKTEKDIPAETDLSKTISKDLKKRGFSFVGPTIIYAYMQAIGMVNDHPQNCHAYNK
ncbi:MAG: DNA-3-methyladenine glycosylase I [Proteobacteria bacterium]|nr:DNA-3-methyladenine glycosylase I [Pseudomonadota bacterium]